MEKKSKFTLRGLTEKQSDFLESYSETLDLGSKNKAILALINEKMASEITQLSKINVVNPSKLQPLKEGKTRIQFSLRNSDYDNLFEVCKNTDTSPSNYIIRLILSNIYSENNKLLGNQIEQLRKSNYEIHKIGVNINQIAKSINSGEKVNMDLSNFGEQIEKHLDFISNILKYNLEKY